MDRWIDEPMGSRYSWVLNLRARLGEPGRKKRGSVVLAEFALFCNSVSSYRFRSQYGMVHLHGASRRLYNSKLLNAPALSSPGLERTGFFNVP